MDNRFLDLKNEIGLYKIRLSEIRFIDVIRNTKNIKKPYKILLFDSFNPTNAGLIACLEYESKEKVNFEKDLKSIKENI